MKKWIYIFICFIGLIILWNYSHVKPDSKKSNVTQKLVDEQNLNNNNPSSSGTDTKQSHINPETYSECEDFKANFNKHTSSWNRINVHTGDKLKESGLGNDEVTLVLEHFSHALSAKRWRIQEIKLNSPHTELKNSLKNKIESMSGSVMPDFINVHIDYPQDPLKDYASMNQQQRIDAIHQTPPTVDDLTYFIQHKKLSANELIELLSFIEQPGRLVGSTRDEELTLLDYAVTHKLDRLFLKLLESGVTPYLDTYLDNTLDFALRRLYADYAHLNPDQFSKEELSNSQFFAHKDSSHDIESTVEIVKMLIAQGLQTDYKIDTESNVTFGYSFNTFELDNQKIQTIYEKYNLDLMAIPVRVRLNEQQIDPTIIKNMEAEKNQYLSEAFEGIDISMAQRHCQTINKKISSAWQPVSPSPLLKKMKSLYNNDKQSMHAALYSVDPSLVLCTGFLQKLEKYSPVDDNIFRIFDQKLKTNQPAEAFTYLSSQSLTQEQKHYLFYQLTPYYPDYLIYFDNAEMIPVEIDYFLLINSREFTVDTLKKLEASRVDTYATDVRGKTLIHYAITRKRIDLLEYMVSQDYSYQGYKYYPDALHLALSSWRYNFTHKNLLKTVELLMQLDPQIDQFHLARMKVIELKYPALYKTLIQNFSQLEPEINDNFPESVCSSM